MVAAFTTPALAQWDSSSVRTVAPGVVHRRVVVNSGPWRINVLEVNLRHPGVSLRGVRANDAFLTRETVSSMAARYKGPGQAVAGINGDFFNVRTGESENNVVIEGRISKGVTLADSPRDKPDYLYSQLGIDWRNRPYIDRFGLFARILMPNGELIQLDGINFRPDTSALVLYTRAMGDSSPPDTTGSRSLVLPLRLTEESAATLAFEVAGDLTEERMSLTPGAVLAATGSARMTLQRIAREKQLRVVTDLDPARARMRTVMGGRPRVVEKGLSVVERSDSVERTAPAFSARRHPRAAAGFSRDSSTLFLVTVDGRRPTEAGMTLAELAKAMIDLGVYEGMNFDGGGSTTMVIQGRVVNRPSDENGERPVGSGLLVIVPREDR